MKHTDLYNEYKKLDIIEQHELIAAVEAHGNEYVFIHIDDEGDFDANERDEAPIIAASTKYMDDYEDFYVSRVEVESGFYTLYGLAKDGWSDEVELVSVAHGHLGYVTDSIPETDKVKDVSISIGSNTFNTWKFLGKYHPNYSQDNNIAWHDDIQKFINDEYDPDDPNDTGNAMAKAFKGDKFFAAVEAERLYCQEMLRAIDAYYKERFGSGPVILPY